MKNKRSQGMPVNIIVIAAISLTVLVVLLIVLTGTTKKTVENIGSCTTKNGQCADTLSGGKCGGEYPIPLLVSGDCPNTKPKNLCCLRAGTDDSQKVTAQPTDKSAEQKSIQV